MTNDMWRYLISGILIVHGLGHSGGYWFFGRSWLWAEAGNDPWKWVFVALWLVAMVGFVAAGLGLLFQQAWWRPLAVVSAVIALPVTIIFLGEPAGINKLAAAVVDIGVLVALLWAHVPSPELVGA